MELGSGTDLGVYIIIVITSTGTLVRCLNCLFKKNFFAWNAICVGSNVTAKFCDVCVIPKRNTYHILHTVLYIT